MEPASSLESSRVLASEMAGRVGRSEREGRKAEGMMECDSLPVLLSPPHPLWSMRKANIATIETQRKFSLKKLDIPAVPCSQLIWEVGRPLSSTLHSRVLLLVSWSPDRSIPRGQQGEAKAQAGESGPDRVRRHGVGAHQPAFRHGDG